MNSQLSLSLTPTAISRVQQYLEQSPGAVGMRFGVEKTGCSGWAYVVKLAEEITDSDASIAVDGVTIVVDQDSLPIVNGTQIDFRKQGINHLFMFDNPNAQAECGCGESFTVSEPA